MARLGTFTDWAERKAVFTRIHSIMEAHDFDDEKGLCTDAGRHENNPIQTIYFAELALEGDGEPVGNAAIFKPSKVERQIFGLSKTYFAVEPDDNGFWYGHGLTARERKAAIRREQENEIDE